jgi:hypothetical protein
MGSDQSGLAPKQGFKGSNAAPASYTASIVMPLNKRENLKTPFLMVKRGL